MSSVFIPPPSANTYVPITGGDITGDLIVNKRLRTNTLTLDDGSGNTTLQNLNVLGTLTTSQPVTGTFNSSSPITTTSSVNCGSLVVSGTSATLNNVAIATQAYVGTNFATQAALASANTDIGTNTTAIGVLNGSSTQSGSVSNSIADALSSTSSALTCGNLTISGTSASLGGAQLATQAYVSSGYATQAALTSANGNINTNATAIGVLNGSSTQSGSVSNSIAGALSSTSSSLTCGNLTISSTSASLGGAQLATQSYVSTGYATQAALTSANGNISTNTTAIGVLNGTATQAGSVTSKIQSTLSNTAQTISVGSITSNGTVTLTTTGGTSSTPIAADGFGAALLGASGHYLEVNPSVVAAGNYFSDSIIGDAVLKTQQSGATMRLGTYGPTSALRIGTTSVKTKNSTLDDGNGNMTVYGTLNGCTLPSSGTIATTLNYGIASCGTSFVGGYNSASCLALSNIASRGVSFNNTYEMSLPAGTYAVDTSVSAGISGQGTIAIQWVGTPANGSSLTNYVIDVFTPSQGVVTASGTTIVVTPSTQALQFAVGAAYTNQGSIIAGCITVRQLL